MSKPLAERGSCEILAGEPVAAREVQDSKEIRFPQALSSDFSEKFPQAPAQDAAQQPHPQTAALHRGTYVVRSAPIPGKGGRGPR